MRAERLHAPSPAQFTAASDAFMRRCCVASSRSHAWSNLANAALPSSMLVLSDASAPRNRGHGAGVGFGLPFVEHTNLPRAASPTSPCEAGWSSSSDASTDARAWAASTPI